MKTFNVVPLPNKVDLKVVDRSRGLEPKNYIYSDIAKHYSSVERLEKIKPIIAKLLLLEGRLWVTVSTREQRSCIENYFNSLGFEPYIVKKGKDITSIGREPIVISTVNMIKCGGFRLEGKTNFLITEVIKPEPLIQLLHRNVLDTCSIYMTVDLISILCKIFRKYYGGVTYYSSGDLHGLNLSKKCLSFDFACFSKDNGPSYIFKKEFYI